MENDAKLKRPINARRLAKWLAVGLIAYGCLAYVILPLAWRHHEHQPRLGGMSMVTVTAQGIPGDPLNVGVVGKKEDVVLAMHSAGWYPADPITLRSSIDIVGSVVLDRPYHDAPVSSLFLEGRREDLAYEKPDGTSADRRNHVRFWKILDQGAEGRPVWLGSATFDRGVGVSHYTGQITHHIAPNVDATRDLLVADLTFAHLVDGLYDVTGVGLTLFGRNGGGDPYYTDGEIRIARLAPDGQRTSSPPVELDSPALVAMKDRIWQALAPK
jgi:hypothetical protein